MRRSPLAGLTALALTGGTLLSAAPAQAADASVLYVRKLSAACSDTGSGTLEQPFCTIQPAAAAATAGQTVDIGGGTYPERVTVANSGTPDNPVVFRGNTSTGVITLSGPTAGLVIDGQHDITIQNVRVEGASNEPGLDLRGSSAITVNGFTVVMAAGAPAPAIRLAAVTDSFLKVAASGPALVAGLTMDAATRGVTVASSFMTTGQKYDTADHSPGIQVQGSSNKIINSQVSGFTGAAIAIEPGAADNVVVNNIISGGAGYGIRNSGATGSAITNNTVQTRCLDGIRVDGASTGVSVQNNVLTRNGYFGRSYCDPSVTGGLELGVYGEAVKDTVVDYNNAYHDVSSAQTIYAWDTPMTLAQFRTASGQAAHDRDAAGSVGANYDSANSAAPGYPTTDRYGNARGDDPAVANTGAGPVTYADRGAVETIRPPVASFDVALDLGTTTVKVDASASTPGFVPIASYQFDFGDGTVVTQSTPVASHRYATPGTYTVTVKVTGTDGRSDTTYEGVSVLRRIATVGLLALANLRYVGPGSPVRSLQPNQTGLGTTAQIELADAGNGQVALFSRAHGRYVTLESTSTTPLAAVNQIVDLREKFTVVRNADGTISLKAAGNSRYVSAGSGGTVPLTATGTTIGTAEKFHRVTVTDANRWLKARVNSRYVTAESAGTKPLIANRTTVGIWERFDVVDLGNGQVALFARADNRFVSAESAGAKPLIANRGAVGLWERFTIVRNSDGTVSFKAAANGRYVTAESAGTKPLIANRTSIGLWEKFTLG